MYKHNFKISILLFLLVINNEAKSYTNCEPCEKLYKEYYRSQVYQPSGECLYKRKKTLRSLSSEELNATILIWGIGIAIGIATVVIAVPQSR